MAKITLEMEDLGGKQVNFTWKEEGQPTDLLLQLQFELIDHIAKLAGEVQTPKIIMEP